MLIKPRFIMEARVVKRGNTTDHIRGSVKYLVDDLPNEKKKELMSSNKQVVVFGNNFDTYGYAFFDQPISREKNVIVKRYDVGEGEDLARAFMRYFVQFLKQRTGGAQVFVYPEHRAYAIEFGMKPMKRGKGFFYTGNADIELEIDPWYDDLCILAENAEFDIRYYPAGLSQPRGLEKICMPTNKALRRGVQNQLFIEHAREYIRHQTMNLLHVTLKNTPDGAWPISNEAPPTAAFCLWLPQDKFNEFAKKGDGRKDVAYIDIFCVQSDVRRAMRSKERASKWVFAATIDRIVKIGKNTKNNYKQIQLDALASSALFYHELGFWTPDKTVIFDKTALRQRYEDADANGDVEKSLVPMYYDLENFDELKKRADFVSPVDDTADDDMDVVPDLPSQIDEPPLPEIEMLVADRPLHMLPDPLAYRLEKNLEFGMKNQYWK
jgi:hypothetical protein